MGDEGKAVGCVPPTALLFELAVALVTLAGLEPATSPVPGEQGRSLPP